MSHKDIKVKFRELSTKYQTNNFIPILSNLQKISLMSNKKITKLKISKFAEIIGR